MNKLLAKYNPQKGHLFLLVLLGCLIPSGIYSFEGVIIPLLFANWLFFLKGYAKFHLISRSTILLACFFSLYVFGLFITEDFKLQFKATTKHLAYVLIPFSLIGFELTRENRKILEKSFVWSTLLFVIIAFGYAFGDYLSTGKSTIYVRDAVESKFSYYGLTRVFEDWHPTYVSFFCNLSLYFVYKNFFRARKYILAVAIAMVLIVTIFLLNSLIGILCLAVLLMLLFLSLFKSLLIKVLIIILLGFGALTVYYFNPLGLSKIDKLKQLNFEVVDSKESRNVLNLRLAKWKTAVDVFKQAPVFGVTPGSYRDKTIETYKKNNYEYAAKQRYSSHNQYFYILASFGIIGIILFVVVLIFPMWLNQDMMMFLLLFSICCLTEDMLLRQQGIVCFSFYYSIMQFKKVSSARMDT